jgi:hypothetical protein
MGPGRRRPGPTGRRPARRKTKANRVPLGFHKARVAGHPYVGGGSRRSGSPKISGASQGWAHRGVRRIARSVKQGVAQTAIRAAARPSVVNWDSREPAFPTIRSRAMRRHNQGPRRSRSIESYLRQTRILAAVALAALVAGAVSDLTDASFWRRHALLAGLAASVIVVMLSIAVINEVIERRRRQRWSVLAQYVMFELVRNARMIWSGILDAAGMLPADPNQANAVDAGAQIVRDTSRLTAAARSVADNDDGRARLQSELAFLAEHADEVLGRWAALMLDSDVYAELMDRHVELAGDVAWLGSLLDTAQPPDDERRQRRARSSAAVQIEAVLGGEWLADRIVVITQLAEELDRGTLELALRVVPVQWWEARLGTAVPVDQSRL